MYGHVFTALVKMLNQEIASFVESLKDNNQWQLEDQWEEQDLEIKLAHLINNLGQEEVQ